MPSKLTSEKRFAPPHSFAERKNGEKMTRVILDSHIISAFVLIGDLARSHPFLSDNPYPLERGGLTEELQNVLLMR